MKVLGDFAGEWALSRQIADAKYGQNGKMIGKVSFAARDGGLIYRETGQLTLAAGAVMQAERSYLWDADDTGIVVRFADGAPFHRFDPVGQVQGTAHLCGDDWYNVTYDFTAWPNWQAKWVVTGPRKDYTSVTRYKPALHLA